MHGLVYFAVVVPGSDAVCNNYHDCFNIDWWGNMHGTTILSNFAVNNVVYNIDNRAFIFRSCQYSNDLLLQSGFIYRKTGKIRKVSLYFRKFLWYIVLRKILLDSNISSRGKFF